MEGDREANNEIRLDKHPFFPPDSKYSRRHVASPDRRGNESRDDRRGDGADSYSPRAQSRERHHGLQLEQLERMKLSAGPMGDEESANQEAALTRLRSFIRGMGKYDCSKVEHVTTSR